MPMANLRLTPLERLFWREFEALLHDSLADGRRMPLPLAEEWQRGGNRFARPGEILIAARADRRLIGCGGCTMAPDLGAADIGRVRRLMSIASCGVAASDVRCSSGSSTTPGSTCGC